MGILDKLRAALAGKSRPAGADGRNYWFHVRCAACGEILKGRVDMYNELSQREDASGFLVRKTLIGSGRCYRAIETTLYFDANRRLSGREIQGGAFVDVSSETPAQTGD